MTIKAYSDSLIILFDNESAEQQQPPAAVLDAVRRTYGSSTKKLAESLLSDLVKAGAGEKTISLFFAIAYEWGRSKGKRRTHKVPAKNAQPAANTNEEEKQS
ncbi:hypothetical protein HCH52_10555 [Oscillospiraceae bacterium HV4-5-C5C]|nr:hypothetical protein [Oscillospiraceae bacterium HV4-5-C5C]